MAREDGANWRQGWLGKLGIASLSLALTLGALELAARIVARHTADPIASRYTEFDPLLGWRHRPGAVARSANGDYRINSRGLRDRERDYAPAAGTFRVLVLGDSFAEGFSVRFEDGVSQVLERSLSRPGCPVEVVNGGTVGYSTDQEYLFYTHEGFRYQPRVIVLLFYHNDILYNARESMGRAPKPLLTFSGGEVRVRNVPLPEPVRGAEQGGAAGPWGSAALGWLQTRLRERGPTGAYDGLARLGLWSRLERPAAGGEYEVYGQRPSRSVLDAWQQTVNILHALNRDVTSRQARLLVVYVPNKMEVSDGDWELTLRHYGVDDRIWDRRRVARLLAEAGRAMGFPVLDLTEPLRRQNPGGPQGPYHAHGGHWNRLGHAVAALEVESFLKREDWVAPCGEARPR